MAVPLAAWPSCLPQALPRSPREPASGEITKVRVAGNRAFVVFHAPGAKLYNWPMIREGAEWKAAMTAASVLVPEM